ncbi:MAG: hypothetical protein R3A80_08910 [Bdellovibrionota bacterium]
MDEFKLGMLQRLAGLKLTKTNNTYPKQDRAFLFCLDRFTGNVLTYIPNGQEHKVFASIFCLMGLSPRLLTNDDSTPNRWESIRDKEHIIIKPIFEYKSFELDITSKNGRSLTWEPNTSISLGSDFYFKDYPGIGASYTLAGQEENKYGATRNYDLRFSYDFKQRYFFFQLDLQHYKSFYAKDPALIPNPVVDSALSLNNLSLEVFMS